MGFREEELKAKGQKAMIDVDLLKHKIVKLQKQLEECQQKVKNLTEQRNNIIR